MPLLLKDVDINSLSKGMRQYVEIKLQHMDSILFFRLGDFYEMFFDDAIVASKELELALTSKDCGLSERAPMCGVPHHACDAYIKRLIDKGYSVVICEQLEDPATAKGIVKRDVIRIVTPGTLTDSSMLDEGNNNWLASIYFEAGTVAVCFADMSTGEAHIYKSSEGDLQAFLINKLSRYSPVEILCQAKFPMDSDVAKFISDKLKAGLKVLDEGAFDFSKNRQTVLDQFSNDSFRKLELSEKDAEAKAISALFCYIADTQRGSVARFSSVERHTDEQIMALGYTARTNLELTKTLRTGEKKGSLLWVLDMTKTSMGKRMLKSWIEQPLCNPTRIMRRLDAVEAMYRNSALLLCLEDELGGVYDLERLMTKVIYKTATPRDLKALASTSSRLPEIKRILDELGSDLIKNLNNDISTLEDIANLIDNAIPDDLPATFKNGGMIKEGFNDELDNLRKMASDGKSVIEEIVAKEREKTGIKNLKSGYNHVYGYYMEVTRSFIEQVPDYFIRKQTLVNAERYITEELKNAENMISGASERILALENEIFNEVREYVANKLSEVQKTAVAVATVDVLASFASVAIKNNYTKPEIAIDGIIDIRNGRHPVVELMLKDELFVPNDAYLDLTDNRMSIITGPNMSGKSTYMRQVALITLMAQIGSFVPADYAKISICDQIFTRVGASDDLTAGQSTFMVEMSEVADIVKNATRDSLVILDEVGRGTSTYDGLSIAKSVAEYIANPRKIGCKTLFATHYHELITLENEKPGIKNYSVAVKKGSDGIRFLRKIVRGGVDESYGLEVAKLAGLPESILRRSREILKELEVKPVAESPKEDDQVSFEGINEKAVLNMLRKTNIDELSDKELRELISDIVRYI
ncbi:MAG: DNA mismatch repair protein MutS [Oscillospiraceae bacterium]|nr:DNA mismatch repair protein MutS [Oscillospiraceae bacterium]